MVRTGLSIRDQKRLASALETLPASLSYLHGALIDLSRQDQELFGCGEADLAAVGVAIEQRTREFERNEARHVLEDDADALRGWIDSRGQAVSDWLGPVAFLEGVLRGGAQFGVEEFRRDVTLPLPHGLTRIELDVPPNMKCKQYNGGIELSERGAQVVIIEQDESTHAIRYEGYTRPPLPGFPAPPHLQVELDLDFRLGKAIGLRHLSRHVNSGHPVMVNYLLKVGDEFVEVGLFSRRKAGSDILKYEPLLASIRVK